MIQLQHAALYLQNVVVHLINLRVTFSGSVTKKHVRINILGNEKANNNCI